MSTTTWAMTLRAGTPKVPPPGADYLDSHEPGAAHRRGTALHAGSAGRRVGTAVRTDLGRAPGGPGTAARRHGGAAAGTEETASSAGNPRPSGACGLPRPPAAEAAAAARAVPPGRGGREAPGASADRGVAGWNRTRVKVKGSWWRHWTLAKAVGVLLAAVGAVIVLGAIAMVVIYEQTPVPTAAMAATGFSQSVVYSGNGTVIGRFGTTNRQMLTYAQLQQSPALINAVLAAEDRNFFNEGGISPTGIMRAAYEDVRGSNGSLQGGSTITQEFVQAVLRRHRHPADAQPQVQGDLRGHEGGQGEVQAVDPHQLPEHDLPG